jgi:hypothetical protein
MIIEIKPTAEGRSAVYVDGVLVGQPCKTEAGAKNVAADYERRAARSTPEAVEARRLKGLAKQRAKALAAAQAAKDARGGQSSGPIVRRRITRASPATGVPPASVPPATVDVERVAQVLGLRIPSMNLNLNAPTKREVRSAVQEALTEVEVEIRERQRQLPGRQYDLV